MKWSQNLALPGKGAFLFMFGLACVAAGVSSAAGIEQVKLESAPTQAPQTLELSDKQRNTVKVEPVGEHLFPIEKGAVGSIDFNEDMSSQVFTPYQGKIIALFGKIGDEVRSVASRVDAHRRGRRS